MIKENEKLNDIRNVLTAIKNRQEKWLKKKHLQAQSDLVDEGLLLVEQFNNESINGKNEIDN